MGDSERFSLIKARFQEAKRGSTKTGTVCYGFLKLLIKMKSSNKLVKANTHVWKTIGVSSLLLNENTSCEKNNLLRENLCR
jgi:hypothetical protein